MGDVKKSAHYDWKPTVAYNATRTRVIRYMQAAVRAYEREQWDEVIEYAADVQKHAVKLLMMRDDA